MHSYEFDKFPLPASFSTLEKLYDIECKNIIKYAYTLNLKTLNPTSLERQNVKLALNIFNEFVIEDLQKNWKRA